jgi:hypothetical protein
LNHNRLHRINMFADGHLVATPKGEQFAKTFGFRKFTSYLSASGEGWKLYFMDRGEASSLLKEFSPAMLKAMSVVVQEDYLIDPTMEKDIAKGVLQLRRIATSRHSESAVPGRV